MAVGVPQSVRLLFGLLAVSSAIFAVTLTCIWMCSDYDDSYLGGVNTNELLFNWHPILMVTGLIFCNITSLVSYRIFPLQKAYKKYIHAFLHTLGVVCVILGVSAVFQGNNLLSKNSSHMYFANLFSLHSYLGLSALICYGINYFVGSSSFLLYSMLGISEEIKAQLLPYHVFLGTFTLFASVIAVETGVVELITELQVCEYDVTSADVNPAQNYHLLPGGCQVANGIGITVLLAAVCAYLAIFEHRTFRKSEDSMTADLMAMTEEKF